MRSMMTCDTPTPARKRAQKDSKPAGGAKKTARYTASPEEIA